MNRFLYLLMALAAGALAVCAQTAAHHKRSIVDGAVESVSGKLQVSLTNTDEVRKVNGAAQISLGALNQQTEKIEFTLSPLESRLFPIESRGAAGDNYTLTIYEKSGGLIFLKNATIKTGSVAAPIVKAPQPPAPAIMAPVPTVPIVVKELTIKARLAAERPSRSPNGSINPQSQQNNEINTVAVRQASSEQSADVTAPEQSNEPQVAIIKKPSAKRARRGKMEVSNTPAIEHPSASQKFEAPVLTEAPISEELGNTVLLFEIACPTPIINASLSVSANEFKQRQSVTVQNSASFEFKLPEEFNEPKISYTLNDASGQALARGELKLEDLKQEDSVKFSDVKINPLTYAPGEAAYFVVTLEGNSPYGYLLEVIAKDLNTETILKDSRKGVFFKGKSIQEIRIDIPAETKGTVTVEFKAFGNLTRKLFGELVREIAVNETQDKEDKENRR